MAKYNSFLLSVLSLVLAISLCSSDDANARLLASKSILNHVLIEGKDLTVQYDIYNVGQSAAINVELQDTSFPSRDFKVVQGFLNCKWSRIAPGVNVSHVVILQPVKSGFFNFTSAELSYRPNEHTTEFMVGYTSAPGEGGIQAHKDYDRRHSPHVLDWAAFAVMTLPSLGIPFLLWHSSNSKYNTFIGKGKKN